MWWSKIGASRSDLLVHMLCRPEIVGQDLILCDLVKGRVRPVQSEASAGSGSFIIER